MVNNCSIQDVATVQQLQKERSRKREVSVHIECSIKFAVKNLKFMSSIQMQWFHFGKFRILLFECDICETH